MVTETTSRPPTVAVRSGNPMLTYDTPATEPAKVTVPARGATTADDRAGPKSTVR